MIYEVFLEAIRLVFLQAIPVVIVLALAGTILAVLQTATAIQEPALSYAAKLLALVALLYFILPGIIKSVIELTRMAWQ